jgi:hypothetical protein
MLFFEANNIVKYLKRRKMNVIRRNRFTVILLLMLLSVPRSTPQSKDRSKLFRYPGALWLSWTASEQANFVYGYIQGYGNGMNVACSAADDLFETDKAHAIGHDNVASTFPSARCLKRVAQYSKIDSSLSQGPDLGPYTTLITKFYIKYPEHRDTPFTLLMEYLTMPKGMTVDDLYRKLTGKSSAPPQ